MSTVLSAQLKHFQQDDTVTARRLLAEALRVYDKDDNGLIPASDLKNAFASLGEPISYDQMDEMIQLLPLDAKGRVKVDDLINLLTKG